MKTRRHNHGLRKRCDHPPRRWPKCACSWHFNFKARGGTHYRFSVDSEAGEHIASKTKAEEFAEGWRIAIRAGTFRRTVDAPAATPAPDEIVTLKRLGAIYNERLGRPVTKNHQTCFGQFAAFVAAGTDHSYGARAIATITEDDLEVFFASLGELAQSTRNKYVQMIKALFRWATKKGYLSRDPSADSDILKRRKAAQRERRLEPDEEKKLLDHAGPHLQRLIIGALETCCRKGELLALTWRDVSLDRREITVRAETSKTKTGRVIPVSARLAAVLEHAKTGPTGEDFEPDDFVFGDAIGRRLTNIAKAWETCILKAHGHTPRWAGKNALAPESRETLKGIELVFHDLRHEGGSRLLESGWPLHNVAHMLGHANIAQTSTYLNATKVGLQDAMRRLDALRCTPVAQTEANRASASVQQKVEEAAQSLIN